MTGSPLIQVLDAKEARGLEFDEVIAVGLSDETWPPQYLFRLSFHLRCNGFLELPIHGCNAGH